MQFSLIHASRGRPRMAEQAILEWTGKCSGQNTYEYILSADADDAGIDAYRELAARLGIRLVVDVNRSAVEAWNRAAARTSGDVLVAVSDDFGCPEEWDLALEAAIGDRRDVAVLVHDGVEGRIMTLPIVDRAWYERYGYILYPEYRHMFCDDDLTHLARATGRLVDARRLVFPHRHHTAGLSPEDDTYRHGGSDLGWWRDQRVYAKRAAAHFGLRPRSIRLFVAERRVDALYVVHIAGSTAKRWLPAGLAARLPRW